MPDNYAVGQAWSYEAPRGFEQSRIVIGAILTFASHEPVICSAVMGAPMLNNSGEVEPLTIPFLPFSQSAFEQTVLELDGKIDVPETFRDCYKRWKTDLKGLGFINIPFKGLLKNMINDLDRQHQQTNQIACIKAH